MKSLSSTDKRYFGSGTTTIPQGLPDDLIRLISLPSPMSTTDTSSDGPFAVKRYFPSGEKAIPHGRVPTLMEFKSSKVAASRTHTVPARPVLTKTFLPSTDTFTVIGREPFGSVMILTTFWFEVSMTFNSPDDSEGMNARELSGRNATLRGRG